MARAADLRRVGSPSAGGSDVDPSPLGTIMREDTEKRQGVRKHAFGGTRYALRANGESVK